MYSRSTGVKLPCGKNGVVGPEAVDVAVFEVECDHALALSVLHDQIQREVLDEVVGVVVQRLNRTLDPCFKQINSKVRFNRK